MTATTGSLPPVAVIVGPTAVGKTEIAIQVAKTMDGEIVSADSRLFYRGMDIGTAKPDAGQRAAVPHHLIDIAEPGEVVSLTDFQNLAKNAIRQIHERGKLPLLVGGTGQYIRAVISGWAPPAAAPDAMLRAQLEADAVNSGSEALHDRLRSLDPEAAERIDHRNVRRTIRALEVALTTGRRFSDARGSNEISFKAIVLGLRRPRPELYARIDERINRMFEQGLLDETRVLLEMGVSPAQPCMSAIGYRECIAVLHGVHDLEEAKLRMRRSTRVFVRRQGNWFRETDEKIHWFDAARPQVAGEIIQYLMKQIDHEP